MTSYYDPSVFLSPLLSSAAPLKIIAILFLLYYAIQSLVIVYHWFRYGANFFTIVAMMGLYFFISLPLVGALVHSVGIF